MAAVRPTEHEGIVWMTTHAGAARVLVVEDDGLIREAFAILLAEDGFGVETARDGVEALELFAQAPADIVVTDLRMPRLDGFGLVARLRAMARTLPVVVVTGEVTGRELRALAAAASQRTVVLSKPVDFNRLRDTVCALLEGRPAEPPRWSGTAVPLHCMPAG